VWYRVHMIVHTPAGLWREYGPSRLVSLSDHEPNKPPRQVRDRTNHDDDHRCPTDEALRPADPVLSLAFLPLALLPLALLPLNLNRAKT
jgi:hypothetical protein